MIKLTYILLASAMQLSPVSAAEMPVSDADVLQSLMVSAVDSLLSEAEINSPSTVFSSYDGTLRPNKTTRDSFDAALTTRGYSLLDVRKNADMTVTLAISSADIMLIKSAENWRRTVSMTVYIRCIDQNGVMVFSGSMSLDASDTLSDESYKATDDSDVFASGLIRSIPEKKKNTVMFATLTLLTAALAVFSGQ